MSILIFQIKSRVKDAIALVVGCALGVLALNFVGPMWVLGGAISALVGTVLLKRFKNQLQEQAVSQYDYHGRNDYKGLSDLQKDAFIQGVKSTHSYTELFKSYIPFLSRAAFSDWKAYYAGQVIGSIPKDPANLIAKVRNAKP